MRISSCIRLAMLASVVWFVASCAHTPVTVTDTGRRFHEGASANAVLHYYRWDSIYMLRPDTREGGFLPLLSREDVARELDQRNVGRDFAVVIVGYRYSPEQQAGLIRDWDAFLNDRGFRRVVILRAGADGQINGLPILHDSAIAGGTWQAKETNRVVVADVSLQVTDAK